MGTSPSPNSINLKGKLLLASPSMEDSFFEKTVIMVTDHTSKKGAKGFILNQPTEKTIGEETNNAPDIPSELSGLELFTGGPVEQNALTMCAFTVRDERLLYTTAINREQTLSFMETPGTLIRCFAGYASWIPGQLENELRENTWIILPALPSLLNMPHDRSLWQNILEQASPMHFLLSRSPKHPFLN